jgi:hypothetical protein
MIRCRDRRIAVSERYARAKLPIVIGLVTIGDLTNVDLNGLTTFFYDEFRSYRQRYPHSPFILLTLADEGSFRLASAAAAVFDILVLNYRSCTPTAPEDPSLRRSSAESPVEESKSGDDARDDARELGTLAHACHVLITVSLSGAEVVDATLQEPNSDSAHTARLSLISTVMDVEPDFRVEVIELLFEGCPGKINYSVSRFGAAGTAFDRSVTQQSSDLAMRRTDDFNRDAATAERRTFGRGVRRKAQLAPLWTENGDDRGTRLQELFDGADTLATRYQIKLRRAFQVIFLLAAAAAVFYGLFLILANGNARLQEHLLAPYLLLLLIAYTIFYLARRSEIHDRFVEYRALAEGIRVQLYWVACGVGKIAGEFYLVRHPFDVHWIRLAMRSATLKYSDAKNASPVCLDSAEKVLKHWISDQRQYYAQGLASGRRGARQARFLVRAIFGLGGCATLAVLFQSHLTAIAPFLRQISLVSFLCPSIAAAVVALVNKLGLEYQVQHYSRMLTIYSQAERYFAHGLRTSAKAIAIALGREALRESGNWMLFRRDRGIEEPSSPFRRPW